jgi:hypothetical protein
VLAELDRRFGLSGITEKAQRPSSWFQKVFYARRLYLL